LQLQLGHTNVIGLRDFFLLSLAFGLFVLKVGLLHLDFFYPLLQVELNVASVAVEFGMLSMIFFAMVKKWMIKAEEKEIEKRNQYFWNTN
jgi:hypothetical protein